MKYFFSGIFFLFVSGCSFFLPSEDAEFSDFIPQEIPEKSQEFFENADSEFDFAQTHFPDKCEWVDFVRVVDGDTIVVNENERVRFIGIDTPETKHPRKPVEPFGIEASKKTQEFLQNAETVCLIADPIGDSYDRYARRLAYIFTESGVDVNAELLRLGLAKAYTSFLFVRKEEFLFLEYSAKERHNGIWSLR